jgi:DNA-binding response OmpR family regulator
MPRILIIDDEASVRTMLRRVLEETGHTVFDAPDGRAGMAFWRREPTDVVVTDIYMPDKDGIEVLLEMKTSAMKPKIIVMSGGGQRGLCDLSTAALSLGADRVLLKPFDPQTLLVAIQEVLAGHADTRDTVSRSRLADQRDHIRVPAYLPVSFGNGAITQAGVVVDISREGCRIRCPEATPVSQYFQVEIHLNARQERLAVDLAERRWSKAGELGVEFIRMDPDDQTRLQHVIRNCS